MTRAPRMLLEPPGWTTTLHLTNGRTVFNLAKPMCQACATHLWQMSRDRPYVESFLLRGLPYVLPCAAPKG